jgi:dTDP-glucose 4,6-dehydratase
MVINALSGKKLPVYGDGRNVRDWLFVDDHCSAIEAVMNKGKTGEIYNIGGNNEWANIDVVKEILEQLGKPGSMIEFVKDRLGHDRRYAMDAGKIMKQLGWRPRYRFEKGLKDTVQWYLENTDWWNKVISGEYQHYYLKNYKGR